MLRIKSGTKVNCMFGNEMIIMGRRQRVTGLRCRQMAGCDVHSASGALVQPLLYCLQ